MENVPIRRDGGGFRGTPVAQVLGMALAFAIGVMLLYAGTGLGIILVFSGIIVYVVLRLFGVRKPEFQLGFGVVLVVSAVLIGGLAVSPSYIDSTGNVDSFDDAGFSNLSVVDNKDGTHSFTVSYETGKAVSILYGEMTSVGYRMGTHGDLTKVAMSEVSGSYTATIGLDSGKVYVYGFESDTGDKTYQRSYSGAVSGSDVTAFCIKWNAYYVGINLAFAFFIATILVAWMRKRMEELRKKLEAEGRLFPPGYGRCAECGNLIMPGMFECRKCGAPVPEELRPKSQPETFECSECGATVGEDDSVCPGCGASFEDEDEKEENNPEK